MDSKAIYNKTKDIFKEFLGYIFIAVTSIIVKGYANNVIANIPSKIEQAKTQNIAISLLMGEASLLFAIWVFHFIFFVLAIYLLIILIKMIANIFLLNKNFPEPGKLIKRYLKEDLIAYRKGV